MAIWKMDVLAFADSCETNGTGIGYMCKNGNNSKPSNPLCSSPGTTHIDLMHLTGYQEPIATLFAYSAVQCEWEDK